MNIKPVKKYSGILPAAAAALLGSLVTSCDEQKIVGIVPRDMPGRVPGEPQEQPTPTTPETPAETPTEAEPEEMPQILGGDVPMENLNLEP